MRLSQPLLVLSALVTFPAIARADGTYREWINECTTGAFKSCFSVQISFLHDVTPGYGAYSTTVDIRVANLQGRTGEPASGPFDLGFFALEGLQVTNTTPWSGSPSGYADAVTPEGGAGPALPDVPGFRTEWARRINEDGSFDNNLVVFFSNPPGYVPIYGCDVPPDEPFNGWQTCSGWLHLTYTLSGTYAFTDGTTAYLNLPGEGFCQVGQCTMQSTPEPNALILMSTGLAGIAGIRFKRRRRINA
ncbi:MAG TPA: PEP-CTERM sorting domain-containing protein [Gemmatimonadales bacterium]|nr:PEP-CTERM sorting domain-containing protein [Gemmatimonadales bacterium]